MGGDQVKSFSYQIGTPANGQHLYDGYVQVSLDPNFNTSTLATLNPANNTWTASLTGNPTAGFIYARQVLSKDLYTPLWEDVQAGPVARYSLAADLETAMTADQAIAQRKQPVAYTITVTNNGPLLAAGVTVTDTFTKTADFGSVSSIRGDWACTINAKKRIINCALNGNLAANDSAVLSVVLKPTLKGTLTNNAIAKLQSPQDPNLTNNTATVSMPVKP